MKMVRYSEDALPVVADAQLEALAKLAEQADERIDLGEMPEITADWMIEAVRSRFYRPIKRQITARVDADVLDWLKSEGRGYQSRINMSLRRAMLESIKS